MDKTQIGLLSKAIAEGIRGRPEDFSYNAESHLYTDRKTGVSFGVILYTQEAYTTVPETISFYSHEAKRVCDAIIWWEKQPVAEEKAKRILELYDE